MALTTDGIGKSGKDQFGKRIDAKTTPIKKEKAPSPIVKELTTPEAWLKAAESGRINLLTVIENIDYVPKDSLDEIALACGIPTA